MSALFPYLTEIHHLRNQVAADSANLKHMRLAPLNTFPRMQIRRLELGLDSRKSRLRFLEAAERKFNANQPRVPAGHSDGGQWTDGVGGGSLSRTEQKPRVILVGATTANNATVNGTGRSTGTNPWINGTTETLRSLTRRIPGAATMSEVLGSMRWTDSIDNHPQEYNKLVADIGNDTSIIPIISSRARSYTKEKAGVKTAVAALSREEVIKYCPNFLTVQQLLDKAARTAGPLSNFGSSALRGTAIHTLLKNEVDSLNNPNLRTEVSFYKSAYAALIETDQQVLPWHSNRSDKLPGETDYGKKFTVRIDVHDKASESLICVYDAKTGIYDFSVPRMDEIADGVARNYGEGVQFFVIGMKPFE